MQIESDEVIKILDTMHDAIVDVDNDPPETVKNDPESLRKWHEHSDDKLKLLAALKKEIEDYTEAIARIAKIQIKYIE